MHEWTMNDEKVLRAQNRFMRHARSTRSVSVNIWLIARSVDPRPFELMLGVLNVLWAAQLALSLLIGTMFGGPAMEKLAAAMPHEIWIILRGVLGLFTIWFAVRHGYFWRKVFALLNFMVWVFIGALFYVSLPWSFAGTMYAAMGVLSMLVYLRLVFLSRKCFG